MMNLTALQEMLDLNEADDGLDIVRSFKKGYDDAKSRHDAFNKSNASKAAKPAEPADPENPQPAKAKTPASPKVKAKTRAEIMQDVTDDLVQYVNDFFTKFPNYGDERGGAEGILKNHPTPEARAAAATAYKNLSNRVSALRKGFNKSIVKSGLANLTQVKKFNDGAKRMAGAQAPAVPQALIKFVRKEAPFFIRLVKINNSAELNDQDFKNLLALKIKQTSPERVPDAVQALNLLFGYMESEFAAQAKVISSAQSKIDNSEREARIAARNASPIQAESLMKIKELLEGMKVKHADMPIGSELKRALAGNGIKVKSMDGEGNNMDGNLTVTMSNDDVIKFRYSYSPGSSNVSAKINGKSISLPDDPHEALAKLKAEYKKHVTAEK